MKKFGKVVLNVFKIISLVVASVMIGYNLYLINAKLVLHEKLPMPFGYGTAVVVSNSMYPYLEVDDLIIIKKTNDYQVGDVIVYDEGSVLVVHRLVSINDETFIAKGDANNTEDKEYSVNLIKGEVVKIYEGAGVIQTFVSHPIVKLLIIVIAVCLFELSFYLDKMKKAQKSNDDEDLEAEIQRLKEELNMNKRCEEE